MNLRDKLRACWAVMRDRPVMVNWRGRVEGSFMCGNDGYLPPQPILGGDVSRWTDLMIDRDYIQTRRTGDVAGD